MSGRPRGFWVLPFEREEGVRAGDERAVVVEAEVAAPLVVIESELAFQLPVVELDRPAQAGEPREPLARRVRPQVGEPVVGWGVGSGRPFDDQPLLARRPVVVADRMGRDDADEGEAALDLLAVRSGATGKRLPGPLWQPLRERAHRLWLPVGSGDRPTPPDTAP